VTRLQFIFFALKSCQCGTTSVHFFTISHSLKVVPQWQDFLKSCLRGTNYPFS